jgi:mRNA-degrading endonuclease RelE of RelBE toxin-antitoxin system
MPTWSKRAGRDLEALPLVMQGRAQSVINRLDTEHHLGKRLVGPFKGVRSARIGRSHRVLFEINLDGTAHILTITPRKDAYR